MTVIHRMIDANLNRAREGLRVMEDVARFALDDATLSRDLKQARHAITAFAASMPGGEAILLANRDTPGDVGTGISTPSEHARSGLADIVASAAGRAAEALRVIEECAKALDRPTSAANHAAGIERTRYLVYDIAKRLTLALPGTTSCDWRLCVIITDELCTMRPWLDVARGALEGGADCLQLREKAMPDGEYVRRAATLAKHCRDHGAAFIVNDRVHAAMLVGATGVHVGQDDMAVADVRRLVGSSMVIGASTHTISEARAALLDGADYVGVGAMHATSTKVREVSGVAYLREFIGFMQDKRPMPHLAIGGITPANVAPLLEAGCRGVAVSSCVCAAPDPRAVCRALRDAVDAARDRASSPLDARA